MTYIGTYRCPQCEKNFIVHSVSKIPETCQSCHKKFKEEQKSKAEEADRLKWEAKRVQDQIEFERLLSNWDVKFLQEISDSVQENTNSVINGEVDKTANTAEIGSIPKFV